jgi:hypothetical protein
MAHLTESLTQAFDRLRQLEAIVGSWEERLRICESNKGIIHSPLPTHHVVSSTKCSVKNCFDECLETKKFCSKHLNKACNYPECTKTRLGPFFCIRHGGGKRCEYEGCTKGASGSIGGGAKFCITHGGGRRCKVENCRSTAKKNGVCSSHGGRYECLVTGCRRSAHGPSKLCTLHGGGPNSGMPTMIGNRHGSFSSSGSPDVPDVFQSLHPASITSLQTSFLSDLGNTRQD